MRRSEAGTLRPVPNQHMHPARNIRFIAGPQADDIFFYDLTAYKIAQYYRTGSKQDKPPAIFTEVDEYEKK